MDISKCLTKLGYKAVVWSNSYEGIKPHELETRPIPTLAELEAVWPEVQAEIEKEANNSIILANLVAIDLKSIRAIRAGEVEWVKKYEEEAIGLREKLK